MRDPRLLSRRSLLLGAGSIAALSLAGCSTTRSMPDFTEIGDLFTGGRRAAAEPQIDQYYLQMYAARPQERFPLPAIDLRQVDPKYWRQDVPDPTGERPGTIVVSTNERFLYLVQENGRAIRYGVGIGKEGFTWSGRGEVGRKAEWPVWTPPPEMIRRQPELEEFRYGQPPGLTNPLGARALYIYKNGRDSGYRIHGNPEVWSIGQAVSSGCVRMLNQDIIDLYGRAPVGAKILVT
jgi:lipoprotein-anchoring transpeptidase ErfK/SrfK